MRYLAQIRTIAGKDLRLEWRTRNTTPAMLVFALTVMIVFGFVFDPGAVDSRTMAPGILVAALTFAGVVGLGRFHEVETEDDAIAGLLLAPVDPSAIYLGKVVAGFVFLSVVEAASLPLFAAFFNLDLLSGFWSLSAALLLTNLGFVATGTVYAAMAANLRMREVLLPVLLFPVLVPVLIAGVKSVGAALEAPPLAEVTRWVRLLLAYDGVALIAGGLTYEYVVEE